ncbi:MAG: FmdB family transcriptional regulator [Actinomycetales bacterium]|nr:FmdB family transcriptional regulator [Actinomycetales bacterium]
MPTYAYACTACEHRFEVRQSFTDGSLTTCPRCEGRLRKLFNAVGIVFKGSGFYRTDSRTSGKGSRSTSGTTSNGSGTTSSGTTSSDSGSTSSSTASGGSGTKDSGSTSSSKTPVTASSSSAA